MNAPPADRLVAGRRAEEDEAELALRPQTLDDFIGQKQVGSPGTELEFAL